MKHFPRYRELDLWRGSAVLGMIVYHAVFIEQFFGGGELVIEETGWHYLARYVQWSFLLLVGLSLHLSWQKFQLQNQSSQTFVLHHLKRAAIVFAAAMLITVATAVAIPEWVIVFGILHFISMSIVLVSFVAGRPLLAGLLAGLFWLLSQFLGQLQTGSVIGIMIGFPSPGFKSLDYFPILPWIALPLLGVFLGSMLYQSYQRQFPVPAILSSQLLIPLYWMSRHALVVYILHAPLLYGIIKAIHLL